MYASFGQGGDHTGCSLTPLYLFLSLELFFWLLNLLKVNFLPKITDWGYVLLLKLPGKAFYVICSFPRCCPKHVEIKGCYCHFMHFLSCWVAVGIVKAALGAEFFRCFFFLNISHRHCSFSVLCFYTYICKWLSEQAPGLCWARSRVFFLAFVFTST